MAKKIGQDIADFGYPWMLKMPNNSFLQIRARAAIHKKKRNNDEEILLKRMSAATAESITKLKVRNIKDINTGKKEYSFSSRKSYTVQICSSPTCLCPLSKERLACFL